MSMTEELKSRKAARAQGFGAPPAQQKQPDSGCSQSAQAKPSDSATEAQNASLAFTSTAAAALSHQLQQKVDVIAGLEGKLSSAADAIAYKEECILNGSTLESMLATRRSQYQIGASVQADATVSIEFEALNGAELLTDMDAPKFPKSDAFEKLLSPAQKARLDRAVLGPAK